MVVEQVCCGDGAPRDRSDARREARGRIGFRAVREGVGLIASSACIGPIPLRCDFLGLRGIGPALAEEARGRTGVRAVREGFCCSPPRLAAD